MKKKIGLFLLIVFVIMQFFRIDKTNPSVDKAQDFMTLTQPNEEITSILKIACYDCHSHETHYPWYTNISPVNWWVKKHIRVGREKLNFSEWGAYAANKANHKLEECAEETREKHMPLTPYWIMHPKAKLSEAQRETLAKWFESKM